MIEAAGAPLFVPLESARAVMAGYLRSIDSQTGHALRMAGTEPRLLALPEAAASGRNNLNRDAGTIRFWFAPEWTSGNGPGAETVLLERGSWSASNAQGWWSLRINAQGTFLRLILEANRSGPDTVGLTLHNTIPLRPYRVLSALDVPTGCSGRM